MFVFFRTLVERVKALFLTDAALDLEAHLLSRQAERKADLLRQAAALEAEGLHLIALELRRQAEALDLRCPLACVPLALDNLDDKTSENQAEPQPAALTTPGVPEVPASLPPPRKKGKAR